MARDLKGGGVKTSSECLGGSILRSHRTAPKGLRTGERAPDCKIKGWTPQSTAQKDVRKGKGQEFLLPYSPVPGKGRDIEVDEPEKKGPGRG